MFLHRDKIGEVLIDRTIRLIGYLGLLAVAIFAVWKIFSKVMS